MSDTSEQSKLTSKQEAFVAAYISSARMNATEAARQAGYTGTNASLRVTGSRLLTNANVDAAIKEWRKQVQTTAIADVDFRVQNLDGMLRDFYQIKQERAQEWAELEQRLVDEPEYKRMFNEQFGGQGTHVPAGAGTGWIVRQLKMIGSGPSARMVEEFGIDTSLVDRVIKVQEEAAKELGQRTEKMDLSGQVQMVRIVGANVEAI